MIRLDQWVACRNLNAMVMALRTLRALWTHSSIEGLVLLDMVDVLNSSTQMGFYMSPDHVDQLVAHPRWTSIPEEGEDGTED